MEVQEWFQRAAGQWGISLSRAQLEQFDTYYQLLIERNKQVNLTRITELREVYGKHFLDSLSLFTIQHAKGKTTLIDVGTGAGFPSIPLKIAFPHLRITLLDSLKKRLAFLEEVVSELRLQNVSVVHGRAEDIAHDPAHREAYDIATARAVAGLNVLSEYCLPFVKVGGLFVAMKGSQVEEEAKGAVQAIKELGGAGIEVSVFHLPAEMGERGLVVIEKKRSSKKMYPRKAGMPLKKPL